jgi:MFS family permease
MTSVLAFISGSLLFAQAPTILPLILFRVLQESGGSMLQPLGMMILTREAGPNRLGRVMAGAMVGGRLIGSCEWKSNLADGGISAHGTARSSPQRLQPIGHGFGKPASALEISSIC